MICCSASFHCSPACVSVAFIGRYFKQVVEVLLTHIIIRDAKDGHSLLYPLDGHHTVVEEQALEHVRVSELVGWEGALHAAVGITYLPFYMTPLL